MMNVEDIAADNLSGIEMLQDVTRLIGDETAKAIDIVKSLAVDFVTSLKDYVKLGIEHVIKIGEAFFGMVKDTLVDLKLFYSNIAERVVSFFTDEVRSFTDALSGAAKGAADTMSGIITAISQEIKAGFSGLTTWVDGAINNASRYADSIKEKLSGIADENLFGQKTSYGDDINDVIDKVREFTGGFESEISMISKDAIAVSETAMQEYDLRVSAVSGSAVVSINHRSGAVETTSGGSAYTAINSAKKSRIAVNINDLKKVKRDAETLVIELTNRLEHVSRVRGIAMEAAREHNQGYVLNDANVVINTCARVVQDTNRARGELGALIDGLDYVINGYTKLERELY